MINIAIIGSRKGFNEQKVRLQITLYLNNIKDKFKIISGGANGIDSFAETYCINMNYNIEIIRPINSANKLDYLFRNIEIITKSDKLLIFWDGESKGTKFVIDYAIARKKEITIVTLNGVS